MVEVAAKSKAEFFKLRKPSKLLSKQYIPQLEKGDVAPTQKEKMMAKLKEVLEKAQVVVNELQGILQDVPAAMSDFEKELKTEEGEANNNEKIYSQEQVDKMVKERTESAVKEAKVKVAKKIRDVNVDDMLYAAELENEAAGVSLPEETKEEPKEEEVPAEETKEEVQP